MLYVCRYLCKSLIKYTYIHNYKKFLQQGITKNNIPHLSILLYCLRGIKYMQQLFVQIIIQIYLFLRMQKFQNDVEDENYQFDMGNQYKQKNDLPHSTADSDQDYVQQFENMNEQLQVSEQPKTYQDIDLFINSQAKVNKPQVKVNQNQNQVSQLEQRQQNSLSEQIKEKKDNALIPLFRLVIRWVQKIEISEYYQKYYVKVKKGKASQTRYILKYERTRLKNFLEQKQKCNSLSSESIQISRRFLSNSKPSHSTYQQLYGSEQSDHIRKLSRKFHQSSDYLKSIVNGNMSFQHKLNQIKYIDKLEKSMIDPETFTKFK